MTLHIDSELVQVAVPKEHLGAVYEALARAMAGEAGETPQVLAEWTEQQVSRLKRGAKRAARVALELTAARPGEWVPYSEVIEQSGRTHDQGRADMAVFSALVKKIRASKEWPIDWEQGAGGTQQVYYRMDRDFAEIWKRV